MLKLLIAFANHRKGEDYLPALGAEDDAVSQILNTGMATGRFAVFRDSFVTRDKLAYNLRLLRNDLFLFHYAGHAGENILDLEDGPVRSEGILKLLAKCKQLKVVILNGCYTQAQAQALHAEGVPIVIGTNTAIGDGTARDFAITFFESLVKGASVATAFEEGINSVELTEEIVVLRKIEPASEEFNLPDQNTWCFLKQEDAEEVRLPQRPTPVQLPDFTPNKVLLKRLFENQNLRSKRLKRLRQDLKDGERVSLADRRIAIINCLPAPIAEQLRKLMFRSDQGEDDGFNTVSVKRLRQLTRLYESLMELLIFTLIAQVYEALMANSEAVLEDNENGEVIWKRDPKVLLSPALQQELEVFLSLKVEDKPGYQYIYLIRELRLWLEAQNDGFFVEELAQLAELFNHDDNDFASSCADMEALRLQLQLTDENLISLAWTCKEGEENMAYILGQLGFLSTYTLATVKSIDIIKYKHQKQARFVHQLTRLRDLIGGLDELPHQLNGFMDNRSVLLLKEKPGHHNNGQLPSFLNLSPFVVDKNAFDTGADSSVLPEIHFFQREELANNMLFFRYMSHPEEPLWRIIHKLDGDGESPEEAVDHSFNNIFDQFIHFMALIRPQNEVVV